MAILQRFRPTAQENFQAISGGPDLVSFLPEIVKSLSSDANLAYLRCQAVRSGQLPRDVALRKTGEIVHSRSVSNNVCNVSCHTRVSSNVRHNVF